jgi:hypothetical protein
MAMTYAAKAVETAVGVPIHLEFVFGSTITLVNRLSQMVNTSNFIGVVTAGNEDCLSSMQSLFQAYQVPNVAFQNCLDPLASDPNLIVFSVSYTDTDQAEATLAFLRKYGWYEVVEVVEVQSASAALEFERIVSSSNDVSISSRIVIDAESSSNLHADISQLRSLQANRGQTVFILFAAAQDLPTILGLIQQLNLTVPGLHFWVVCILSR